MKLDVILSSIKITVFGKWIQYSEVEIFKILDFFPSNLISTNQSVEVNLNISYFVISFEAC